MESEKGNGEMNEKIAAILDGYRDEMIEKLQEIIRIESVAEMEGEVGKCDAPFGEGPKKALEYMMELGFQIRHGSAVYGEFDKRIRRCDDRSGMGNRARRIYGLFQISV